MPEIKTFTVILETTIEARTKQEAHEFAFNGLSIIDHRGKLYETKECRVVESTKPCTTQDQ